MVPNSIGLAQDSSAEVLGSQPPWPGHTRDSEPLPAVAGGACYWPGASGPLASRGATWRKVASGERGRRVPVAPGRAWAPWPGPAAPEAEGPDSEPEGSWALRLRPGDAGPGRGPSSPARGPAASVRNNHGAPRGARKRGFSMVVVPLPGRFVRRSRGKGPDTRMFDTPGPMLAFRSSGSSALAELRVSMLPARLAPR